MNTPLRQLISGSKPARNTRPNPHSNRRRAANLIAAVGIGCSALGAARAPVTKNADCLLCHGDKTLAKDEANGKTRSMFVDEAKLKASVHGTNACMSCHGDLTPKHPDSWIAWLLGSDETFRRWSDRIAGLVMLGLGGYHLLYVTTTREGRQLLRDFLPGRNDAQDIAANARHLLRAHAPKPQFGRFGYPEKFEYWAVVWGTIIMGITGLMIWFKIDVTRFLPRWAVDVATTIHYYEAILAILAIVVWHFYHVIFDPDVYPFNWAWWDGKVSAHWYRDEHPLHDPTQTEPPWPAAGPPANRTNHESAEPQGNPE